MTNRTTEPATSGAAYSVDDRSGVELLVEVGTLLSASTVTALDSGLELSVVAVAAYVGGRRGELVVRPASNPGPTDPFPLAGAEAAAGPTSLADAPGLTPGLPPMPEPGVHAASVPPPLTPAAGPAPLPDLPAGTPGIGAAPGLSDIQWQRLDEGRPIVDATSLGGPAVLLPVSHEGQVLAALRIGGLVNEAAVVENLKSGERGEVAVGAGALIGAAIARRRTLAADESEERQARAILDQIGSVIVQVDMLGRISYVNQAWTRLTGIPTEDMIGRNAMDRVHPDDHHVAAEHLVEGMRDQAQRTIKDVRFLDRDGRPRWMEVQGKAILNAAGEVIGFGGTLHDVTERRQETLNANAARDRAEQARDRAERSNRAKSEFLSRMSHELRTPLNAILGFAQLLELAELDHEDADNLNQIVRAGRHLLAVINDALDVARIETGRLSLSVEDVRVEPVVDECLDLMRPAAEENGIALGRPTASDVGMIARADRQRLRQVLINLLSNAVKYNRRGGQVTVEYHPADDAGNRVAPELADWLRITVADSGIGIPADRLNEVFVPFERLGAERTGVEGTGLGLSLAKSLMDAMGARISLSSIEGIGTTFHLDLPAMAAMPDSDHPPVLDLGPNGPTLATTTVLYVEDNPANVTLVQRVLSKREKLHLVVAPDGASGVRLVEELRPALVLLDVHLPEMSGDEVLAAVRNHADPVLRRTPVIIVTADVSGGAERRLRTAGADAFIAKPIDVHRLLTEVDLHLT
ncbi:ATP-binding protein [Cryptosporangium aurantiacum]|uniref:ATP-binding protein n=1 Tax=Cryptosporangium aurantiacum TaxID=134849 RepID=UPI0009346AA9|nr:ATP-binding protein [Cryptosporangium aurantiacum]